MARKPSSATSLFSAGGTLPWAQISNAAYAARIAAIAPHAAPRRAPGTEEGGTGSGCGGSTPVWRNVLSVGANDGATALDLIDGHAALDRLRIEFPAAFPGFLLSLRDRLFPGQLLFG